MTGTAAGEAPLRGTEAEGREAPGRKASGRKAGGGKAAPEQRYEALELARNAGRLFGTRGECVEAALRAAGMRECTLKEAQETVARFLEKEVRQ